MDKKEFHINTNLENVKEGTVKIGNVGSTYPTPFGYWLMMRNGDRRFTSADIHKETPC